MVNRRMVLKWKLIKCTFDRKPFNPSRKLASDEKGYGKVKWSSEVPWYVVRIELQSSASRAQRRAQLSTDRPTLCPQLLSGFGRKLVLPSSGGMRLLVEPDWGQQPNRRHNLTCPGKMQQLLQLPVDGIVGWDYWLFDLTIQGNCSIIYHLTKVFCNCVF